MLAATLTRDPFTVSAVMFAEWLPWLLGTQMVTQELAGPPAGGFLFSVANWIPFAVDAVSFGVSSALVAAIPGRRAAPGSTLAPGRRTSLRAEIAEGLRWLFAHRVLRAMAVLVAGANIALTGSDAIMVLFAQERLGLAASASGCCSPARPSVEWPVVSSLRGSAGAWGRSRS